MFNMSKRWWAFAISVGVVGSLAIFELLVVPQSAYLPCDGPLRYCPYPIEYDTGAMLIRAAVSFLAWLGIGCLIFLIVSTIPLLLSRVGRGSGIRHPSF
jgi:hypothetical protein